MDGWIKKIRYVCVCVYTIYTIQTHTHTHTRNTTQTLKRKEILPFGTKWMKLEDIMLSEINQTEKDKCHMISLIWNLKTKTKQPDS